MEKRVYRISWKYKITVMIGMTLSIVALFVTIYRYEMDYYWGQSWFSVGIIFFLVMMLSSIYFFAYKIVVSDDFISTRQLFYVKKIYFKEIQSIRSSGLNDHIKKIKGCNKTLRIVLNDTINKPYELAMEIEIIRRQYAVVRIN